MSTVLEWARLTWPEAQEAVRRMPACVLPLGAIEAHGPHLPLETDNLLSTEKCRRVCERTGVILMPTLPYGQVWSLYDFPGTLSVSVYTLIAVLKDLIRSFRDKGFKLVFIYTGHLGNAVAVKQAIRECYDEGMGVKCVMLDGGFGLKGASHVLTMPRSHPTYIHACEIETSMMLECAPDRVHMDRAVRDYPEYPYDFNLTPTPWSAVTSTGVLGDATAATPEKGRALVAAEVDAMVELVWRELADVLGLKASSE